VFESRRSPDSHDIQSSSLSMKVLVDVLRNGRSPTVPYSWYLQDTLLGDVFS
jgi:hypothetical protein